MGEGVRSRAHPSSLPFSVMGATSVTFGVTSCFLLLIVVTSHETLVLMGLGKRWRRLLNCTGPGRSELVSNHRLIAFTGRG